MQQLIISDAELADLFGTTHLGSHALQELSSRNLIYREVTPTELLRYEARVAEYMSTTIQPSGFSYQEKWNVGWSETLADFREDPNASSLVPKFVRKGLPIRYKGRWIMPLSDSFETDFVHILRAFLVDKYLVGLDTLVEFGAGTGHNLVHMNQLGISRVVGFDWSEPSVQLMSEIALKMAIPLESYKLDMFDPVLPNGLNFGEHFSILTVGAMEQLGTKWQPFLELLMNSGAKVVMHLETNYEDLDPTMPFEAYPREYIRKRNWLQGYFQHLKILDANRQISNYNVTRTFGSFFHDGYTLTTWSPATNLT